VSSASFPSPPVASSPSAPYQSPSQPASKETRQNLFGVTYLELQDLLKELGEKPYRASQIFRWLYVSGARDFSVMTDINKQLRQKLEDKFVIDFGNVAKDSISVDTTRKWLVEHKAGGATETVYIPYYHEDLDDEEDERKPSRASPSTLRSPASPSLATTSNPSLALNSYHVRPDAFLRGAVCVSSQVGCSLTCAFCHTGSMSKQGLRNLNAGEIVSQVRTLHTKC